MAAVAEAVPEQAAAAPPYRVAAVAEALPEQAVAEAHPGQAVERAQAAVPQCHEWRSTGSTPIA